jgi:hypothetical protein
VLKTRKDSDSHPPPLPGGGLPGMHRTRFQKKEKSQNRISRISLSMLDSQNLFTISKFCMIFVVVIPVLNYNAQIAFKKEDRK